MASAITKLPMLLARRLPRAGMLAVQTQNLVSRGASSSSSSSLPQGADGMRELAKATRLNHVAIAVPNIKDAAATYRNLLGAKVSDEQVLEEHGVRVVFVELSNTKLELLEPLSDKSPIANFLEKNKRGGIHHICVDVGDIDAAMENARSRNVRMLNEKPKIGAHGNPVCFMHPNDTAGVLLEFEEPPK